MPSVTIKRKVDRIKGRAGGTTHYSPKQRLEVVTAYLMLGKVSLVSATTNVPEETIHRWKAQDWFKSMVDDVRTQSNVQVSGRLKQVINKSLMAIDDRLENGDYQYNPKTSTFIRVPVSARTATDIMNKAVDKQVLIDKLESGPTQDMTKIEDRLKAIQDKLLEVSRFKHSKPIQGVIDVETPVGIPESVGEAPRSQTDGESGQQVNDNVHAST